MVIWVQKGWKPPKPRLLQFRAKSCSWTTSRSEEVVVGSQLSPASLENLQFVVKFGKPCSWSWSLLRILWPPCLHLSVCSDRAPWFGSDGVVNTSHYWRVWIALFVNVTQVTVCATKLVCFSWSLKAIGVTCNKECNGSLTTACPKVVVWLPWGSKKRCSWL